MDARFAALVVLPNAVSLAVSSAAGSSRGMCPRATLAPPGWVFAVVWPTLYLLLGVAMARADAPLLARLFVLVAALNAWWVAFSGRCAPVPALAGILSVLSYAAYTAWYAAWSGDATGASLLVPLVAWLSFASLISVEIALRH